jgi:GTP pyrophosphokinase
MMAHKEMVYLKGFAKGRQFFNMLKMIALATKYHEGQFRKTGEPYIDHPMRVTSALVALGVEDDITLCASLGHDIVEDTSVTPTQLRVDHGIDQKAIDVILLLSKSKETTTGYYYKGLEKDIRAILIKLADRCHNISTMFGAFTSVKMKEYVLETEHYVLPLCKYGRDNYPEYSNVLFTMKYHIESMLVAAKGFIAKEDTQN